jgi:hemerythrin-like domain-containing protein
MTPQQDPFVPPEAPTTLDGFDVLDACHRHTLFTLGKLAALVARLKHRGPDADARTLAAEVVDFFSTTARQHHVDEERHVFPPLLAAGDPTIVQAVMRLQQDHRWLDVDWSELSPLLQAVAAGHSSYDITGLQEMVEVFTALYHDHIGLEEGCIYPQARVRLGTSERQEMGREMAARRHAQRDAAQARSSDSTAE